MTNRFLISVAAAALIAGTGFANAQGTGTSRERWIGSDRACSNAPSSGGGAMHKDQRRAAGMKGAESTKGAARPTGMKASESEKAGGASKSAQDTKPRTEVEEHELGERRGQGRQGHEGRGP